LKYDKIIADEIKPSNVKHAYQGYVRALGEYLERKSNSKGVFEFREDALGKARISTNTLGNLTIEFKFNNGVRTIEDVIPVDYYTYWKRWKKITNDEKAKEIFRYIYDLLGVSDRRTKGQYYTPENLAKLAWESLISQLGNDFWLDGTWRIWDCCAGTGNLEYKIIPDSAKQYLYLSTLDMEEVEQLLEKFDYTRETFQFDFINDNFKQLPKNLSDDISNKNLKWLIFVNPPYVESQGKSNVESGTTASNTQKLMNEINMGNSAREMFAQFIFNIEEHLKDRYYLGLFSNAKYITSKKFEVFRYYWNPVFDGGFVVNAGKHFQMKGNWPLLFSRFNRLSKIKGDFYELSKIKKNWWENQNLSYEVLDSELAEVAIKVFKVYSDTNKFRDYFDIDNSPQIMKLPLLESAIKLTTGREYCKPYVQKDFLATMVFIGPDFQQQNRSYIVSGVANTNHNNIYITRKNYKNILSAFALYNAPEFNWLRDRDFFQHPNRVLNETDLSDCILYAILSISNNTATFKFSNGDTIVNLLNPMDNTMFDFSKCSQIGMTAFAELVNYLENIVNYKTINTAFGKGKFLGLYQYRTKLDSDHQQCFGYEFPDSFKSAIEDLRKHIASISEIVCLP
jgi:16S rRNA G966 N2-methylase RsmD